MLYRSGWMKALSNNQATQLRTAGKELISRHTFVKNLHLEERLGKVRYFVGDNQGIFHLLRPSRYSFLEELHESCCKI